MNRDFDSFLDFCKNNIDFGNMAYNEAFKRIINRNENNHSGHFKQLFYAIYDFYDENPNIMDKAGVPPFEIKEHKKFQDTWRKFILPNDRPNQKEKIGYSYESLRNNLPVSCGGSINDGGRWSPTAKILFSVIPLYMKS